jgi:hypothetical protein
MHPRRNGPVREEDVNDGDDAVDEIAIDGMQVDL